MRIQALRSGLVAMIVMLLAGAPMAAQERAPESTAEGIQVHGHWIIEIYDGNHLVDRREFDNALTASGEIFLADLLSGENSIGPWTILAEDADKHICDNTADGSCSGAATVSSPESGDQHGQLILEASFAVQLDGSITSVRTQGTKCSSSTAPSDCGVFLSLNANALFTQKNFASPIDVVAGQQVNVTVIISFTG